MNYGTIDFWKKVTKWCDKFVEYDREKKTIDMSLHNASRLISIISRKNVKQTTRETVYNFTKELLENLETNITIGRLNNLSKSLLDGRIG
jgi:CRISPR/Cas system Type II protein with McrA/HNH and RuvC-like nuclease domain